MVDLRRNLDRGLDVPLLRVTTPERNPSYFRTTVLTSFNGDTWTPGDRDIPETQVARGKMPDLTGVAVEAPREEMPFDVEVTGDFDSTWLPTTPQVSVMEVEGDWRYDTSTMDFMTTDDDTTTSSMSYSFVGVSVQPDPALMDNAVSGAADVRSAYLEVSTEVSDDIRNLAATVTKDATTRFRKAQALQQWFREDGNFEYSTADIENADEGNLDSFLDESGRIGYCEQFAASMAIMARILGIPARVAVGFLEPERIGPDTYEFSSHDLHAWPELFFPGAGWVRFEPTPGARAPGVPSYTDVDLGPEASAEPSPSATQPSEELAPRGETAPSEDAVSDEGSSFPWLSIVLVLLGVLLVLALVLVPTVVRRRRRDRRLDGGIEDLWLELRDHAVDLGHGWPRGRSPRVTGDWLSAHFGSSSAADGAERPRRGPEQDPVAVEALDRLVGRIERARYSRSGDAHPSGQAADDVRVVEAALDHGVGPRVRRWSRWLPRSLRPAPHAPATEVVTRETADAFRG
jgi:transglutaminase-like putative cysteine protease